jgi:hypothetical protein
VREKQTAQAFLLKILTTTNKERSKKKAVELQQASCTASVCFSHVAICHGNNERNEWCSLCHHLSSEPSETDTALTAACEMNADPSLPMDKKE